MGNIRVFAICFFVALGPAIFGLETAELGGFQAMPPFVADFGVYNAMTRAFVLPADVQTLLSAMFNGGAVVGSLCAGPFGRHFGRRWGLATTGITILVGIAIQIASTVNVGLYIGRFIAGFGVGGISNFVPMYQAEVAPARLRGVLMASYQFLTGLGQLVGSCINFGTHLLPDRMAYRIPLITQLGLPIILTLGTFVLPESPRWLLTKGKEEKAYQALKRARPVGTSDFELTAELEKESAFVELDQGLKKMSIFWDCLKGTNLRRTHIASGVMAWSLLSGISFINGYGTYFFAISGVSQAFTVQVILTCCGICGLLCNFVIVSYVGRRPLLIWGAFFQAIAMFTFAIVGTVLPTTSKITSNVLITFICLYGFTYNLTWGPVGWMVLPEVVSNNLRSPTVAIATGFHWGANLLVTCGVPYLINPAAANLGLKTGFVFGVLNAAASLWTWFFVPETKNRTLEEIDEMFIKKVPIKSFKSYMCTGQVDIENIKE